MRRVTVRTVSASAVLLSVLVSAPGCADIPDSGPVLPGTAPETSSSVAPFDFSPPRPQRGATPDAVVRGFLTAQQATPSSTTVARAYLTDRADERWSPEQGTLLYGDVEVEAPAVTSGRLPVVVRLTTSSVFGLDGSGRWSGRQPGLEDRGLTWTLVKERGQWRIADPPDALLLPLAHVDNRFQRFSVYFADPTGSVLVPEPIYLPMELQTPTQLVEAVLTGPQGRERRADRSFLPVDAELEVSVPVTPDGVAQVPLSAELLELDRNDLMVAVAQLVWTLRQVPEILAVSLTADGEPVVVPDVGVEVPVTAFDQYSPLGISAASDLYGLRGRRVVRVEDGRESGLLRLPDRVRPEALAVSLLGNPLAVSDTAGTVRVLARGSDERGAAQVLRTVATPGVSGMAWDWSRTLWIGPRRVGPVRAVLGDTTRLLAWPGSGLEGRQVQAFTVSRDGTRVVMAVAPSSRGGGSELWAARVARSSDQSVGPVALRAARRVRTAFPLPPVVELGWRDAQTLAVLVRRDQLSSRLLAVPVDGQGESRVLSGDSDVLFGRAIAAAVSPVDGEALVVTAGGQVHHLSEQGRWRLDTGAGRALRSPTFVG